MKRKNTTRNALFTSIISMLLCVSMLVGTTFAWFTDEVVSGMNTIAAGNLDIEVTTADGKSIQDVKTLFNDVTLWEPGVVAYENLTVSNEGSLALKYNLSINFANENTVNGYGLSQVLKVAIVREHIADNTDREDLVKNIHNWTLLSSLSEVGTLLPEAEEEFSIVIWWEPSDQDNNWNVNNDKTTSDGEPLHIELGVSVFATQLTYEKDSFDETYDKDTESFTIAEANQRLANNEDVTLINCYEQDGVLEVPASYTGKLILKNVKIKSVQAAGDVEITILGNVVVNAKGTGAATVAAASEFDGTAISAKGSLSIIGNGHLTAIAADVDGASGIGGVNATAISISGITVDYAAGSYIYGIGDDTKYYKDAPQGGAAIGTGVDGATITLKDVIVTKAIGGSKAAGIGARYHTGVTINITDSTIAYAEGGVSAAGIGSSRVSKDGPESGTTINITGSTVTAKGGVYGAGIGSGYDTHCQSVQPLCTINISGSTINATGGQYAAGVGTGYHNAALAGEIKNSTVNAVSGEKFYKDTYTQAQDIGFGVVDPAREGQQTASKLIYNGAEIKIPEVIVIKNWEDHLVVTADTTRKNEVAADYVEICHQSGNLTLENITFKNGLTIYTNNVDNNGTVTLRNCTIYLNDGTGDPDYTSNTQYKAAYGLNLNLANGSDVTFVFENCTFTAADDYVYTGANSYNVYIGGGYSAESVTFTGCTFEGSGKHAIGCSSQGDSQYYALTITGCNFKNWNNDPAITNGAAIRGNLPSATFAANIAISGNTYGNNNGSTQQTVAIDSWTGSWN